MLDNTKSTTVITNELSNTKYKHVIACLVKKWKNLSKDRLRAQHKDAVTD